MGYQLLLYSVLLSSVLQAVPPSSAAAPMLPHYGTGIYADSSGAFPITVQLHVDHDGLMTGSFRGLSCYTGGDGPVALENTRLGSTYYFDGTFRDDLGLGRSYEPFCSVALSLIFEEDILELNIGTFTPGNVPSATAEPIYLLRQPGPGPESALIAPVWLLEERGDPQAIFMESAHGRILVGDAYIIRDMLALVTAGAGYTGDALEITPLVAVRYTFGNAPPALQERFTEIGSWWPQWQADWERADASARLEVARDLLLMTYGERVAGEAAAEEPPAGAGCDRLFECLAGLFDEEQFAQTMSRTPCISPGGCQ